MKLTRNEQVVIDIMRNECEYGPGGWQSHTWLPDLVDCMNGHGIPKKSHGGIISSLVQKGILFTDGTQGGWHTGTMRDPASVGFTKNAERIFNEADKERV